MAKLEYHLREIDAWIDPVGYEDGYNRPSWYWNDSFHLETVYIEDGADVKRAFSRALHKLGFVCKNGVYRIVDEGNAIVLQQRKDDMPLYALVPMFY